MRKKYIFIMGLIIILLTGFFVCYNFAIIMNSEFNRAVYSVVLFNDTDVVLDDLTISYGRDNAIESSVCVVEKITDLQPKEYRKINISTSLPSAEAKPPYNVWVKFIQNGVIKESTAGYFGIDTGGLAVISITTHDKDFILNRILSNDKVYKKIYRRNLKKQNELSWY